MDSSPLILAQSHARQAVAVSSVDPTKALGEHDRAANQYASAAKDTSNSEAFRTLKLLEGYHQRLSQLMQFQTTHPISPATETNSAEEKSTSTLTPSPTPPKLEDSPYRSHDEAVHRQPQILQPSTTSSIASNLASARGIPPHRQRRGSPASPASSIQHAEGKLSTPQRRSKLGDYPSRAAPSPIQEKIQAAQNSTSSPEPSMKKDQDSPQAAPSTDEPFARFYSTFSPLISALSAPLAFAGLPLGLDQRSTSSPSQPQPKSTISTPSSKPSPKPESTTQAPTSLTDNPDYTRAFSRAALRALHLNAQESFYVVPTAGGQISYADILTRTQREAARGLGYPENLLNNNNSNEDEQEFVDARETPPSPVAQRGGATGVRGKGGKTMEELELENRAMRDLLDVLSKRLAQFEMGSQSQSQALWQSFRMMNPAGGPNPQVGTQQATVSGDGDGKGDGERVKVLKEEVEKAKKEMERMGRENEKLKGVVGRYRERWEKLKEGARGRREGTGAGA